MYQTHFGLTHRPFRPMPDADSYYPATGHESALASLCRALDEDEGLILLTGDAGTGKTLLCHKLLERIAGEAVCAFLTNSHADSRAGLLQAILYDLSLPYEGRSEQELRLALTDFVLKKYGEHRRCLIVVDEAQHLGVDLLEELRLLGNLESRRAKAVQVVLAALPGMDNMMRRPELASFRQRLAVRVKLEALDANEAADYLFHQVRVAGGRPDRLLASDAVELLTRATQGNPRLLNQAAHQALTVACEAGNSAVDVEAALEALARLGLSIDEAPEGTAAPADDVVLTLGDIEGSDKPETQDEEAAASCLLAAPARPA